MILWLTSPGFVVFASFGGWLAMGAGSRLMARVCALLMVASVSLVVVPAGAAGGPLTGGVAGPLASEGDLDGDGGAGLALARAARLGRRVEVVALRSERSRVFALPSGMLRAVVSSSVQRVWRGGRWHRVDLDLAPAGDGWLRPRVSADDVAVSRADGSLRVAAGGVTASLSLPGRVRVARDGVRVRGSVARVAGGSQVRVGDGSAGLVIPVSRGQRRWRLGSVVAGGRWVADGRGGARLVDGAGGLVAWVPVPVVSSRRVDAVSGNARRSRRVRVAPRGDSLVVSSPRRLDWSGLLSLSVVLHAHDTWMQKPGYETGQTGSPELRVGTWDGGVHVARSWLRFNDMPYAGATVDSAELRIRNFWSYSCQEARTLVQRVKHSIDYSKLKWGNQPTVDTDTQVGYRPAHGWSDTQCPTDDSVWNVTGIVRKWAGGGESNGFRVATASETNSKSWRKFRSANFRDDEDDDENSTIPRLVVNYTQHPRLLAGSAALAPPLDSGKLMDLTPSMSGRVKFFTGKPVQLRVDVFKGYPPVSSHGIGVVYGSVVSQGTTEYHTSTGSVPASFKFAWGQEYSMRFNARDVATGVLSGPDFGQQDVRIFTDHLPTVSATSLSPFDPATGATYSMNPTVTATVSDPDVGQGLWTQFEVWRGEDLVGSREVQSQATSATTKVSWLLQDGVLENEEVYTWRARTRDQAVNPATRAKDLWSAWSAPFAFAVEARPDPPRALEADPRDGDVLESLTPSFEAQLVNTTDLSPLFMDLTVKDASGTQIGPVLTSTAVDSGFRAEVMVPEGQGLQWSKSYTFTMVNRYVDPVTSQELVSDPVVWALRTTSPPVVSGLEVDPAGQSGTAGSAWPVLSALVNDDLEKPSVLTFVLSRDGQQVASDTVTDVESGSRGSWWVPTGLVAGAAYTWTVTPVDSAGATGATGSGSFTLTSATSMASGLDVVPLEGDQTRSWTPKLSAWVGDPRYAGAVTATFKLLTGGKVVATGNVTVAGGGARAAWVTPKLVQGPFYEWTVSWTDGAHNAAVVSGQRFQVDREQPCDRVEVAGLVLSCAGLGQ